MAAGVRPPNKLTDLQRVHHTLFDELQEVAGVLEKNYSDMQVFAYHVCLTFSK